MKITKTQLLILPFVILFAYGSIIGFSSYAQSDGKHYVTKVTPASFTDIVEFYGNTFLIDDVHTALCLERAKDTPYPGVEITLSYLDNPYIHKILYYGYNGPAQWKGFSSDGEAILCTSIMLSDAYSGYGYKDICDDFKKYIDNAPESPIYSLSFYPSESKAYIEGNIQRTGIITVTGDPKISTNITLGTDMKLHFSDGTVKTGIVTVYGGDSFYISSPINSEGIWNSGTLYINETSYSVIIAQTASSNMQDLAYLVPNPPNTSGLFSISWYDKGSLEIIKSSSISHLADNNYNYSLSGAHYQLYSSYTDAEKNLNPICTLITDNKGYAKASNLTKGTYYLKETLAPNGYYLSDTITPVTINALATTTIDLSDTPIHIPISILLKKTGSDGNPLEGAEFEVNFYSQITSTNPSSNNISPTKSWILKSDSLGYVYMDESHLISGDEFYTCGDKSILPLGTLTIKETKAPYGYYTEENIQVIPITKDLCTSPNSFYNPPIIRNELITQPFEIIKYGESSSHIDNPLSGAGFMVCPTSELETDENGNYIWDLSKTIPITTNGDYELFTNDSGYAISIPLPYGTYLIRETTVPPNYLPVEDFLVTINENSSEKMIYLTDKSFKAYIKITKQDSSTKQIILDNPATFKIWSYRDNRYISFELEEAGSMYTIDEFQTDSSGTLITPEPLMPGKYLIEEVSAPAGYYISSATSGYVIDISDSLEYETYIDAAGEETDIGVFTVCVENKPITGQIKVIKTFETPDNNGEYTYCEGIQFNIYATNTIYSPDGNHTIIYNKGELVETITTDKNGIALSSDALPLGTYTIEEINTPPGYVKAPNKTIDLNLSNNSVEILETEDLRTIICHTTYIQNNLIKPEVLGETYTPETGDFQSITLVILLIFSFIASIILFKKINK